jgi:hypothetical protein
MDSKKGVSNTKSLLVSLGAINTNVDFLNRMACMGDVEVDYPPTHHYTIG